MTLQRVKWELLVEQLFQKEGNFHGNTNFKVLVEVLSSVLILFA